MSEKLNLDSNPRRLRSLGVVIKLGDSSNDELYILKERLNIAQSNLTNDQDILDAAIDDRFKDPELTFWTDEELVDFGEQAA